MVWTVSPTFIVGGKYKQTCLRVEHFGRQESVPLA